MPKVADAHVSSAFGPEGSIRSWSDLLVRLRDGGGDAAQAQALLKLGRREGGLAHRQAAALKDLRGRYALLSLDHLRL